MERTTRLANLGQVPSDLRQAPVNYFEGTFAFGDLSADEAAANLASFAETRHARRPRGRYREVAAPSAGAGAVAKCPDRPFSPAVANIAVPREYRR